MIILREGVVTTEIVHRNELSARCRAQCFTRFLRRKDFSQPKTVHSNGCGCEDWRTCIPKYAFSSVCSMVLHKKSLPRKSLTTVGLCASEGFLNSSAGPRASAFWDLGSRYKWIGGIFDVCEINKDVRWIDWGAQKKRHSIMIFNKLRMYWASIGSWGEERWEKFRFVTHPEWGRSRSRAHCTLSSREQLQDSDEVVAEVIKLDTVWICSQSGCWKQANPSNVSRF